MLQTSIILGAFARRLKTTYVRMFELQLVRYAYIVASASLGEDCTFAQHCRTLAIEQDDQQQVRELLTTLRAEIDQLLTTLENQ